MCDNCDKTEINNSCLMCGSVKYPPGFVPYKKLSELNEAEYHKQKRSGYPRWGTCIKCQRPGMRLDKGLCAACLYAVSGRNGHLKVPIGSRLYWKQLHEYREKRWPEKFLNSRM